MQQDCYLILKNAKCEYIKEIKNVKTHGIVKFFLYNYKS